MANLPSIVIYQSIFEKIEHSALLYVGFQQLVRAGEISFEIARMPRDLSQWVGGDDLVVCGTYCQTPGSIVVRFAVDLRDRCDRVNTALLSWSDVYFKRSIQSEVRVSTDLKLLKKLQFYGLNFAARNDFTAKESLMLLKNLMTFPAFSALTRIKVFASLPPLSQFEQSAEVPVASTIIFQTRVWTASEVPLGDSEAINEQRVTLIRSLRNHFGPKFQGGLVSSPLALSRYPEYLSPLPSKRRSYAQTAKQNLIGIYSEGLSNSTAFKFLEYLAGSQCIVAEKVANKLPENCVEGRNFLEFSSPEECIKQCEYLLTHQKFAQEMRRANERLYINTASPTSRAKSMLLNLATVAADNLERI
jgi:hypothetical protein